MIRIKHWNACWESMLDRPIVGVGPAQWGFVAPQYDLPLGMAAHTTWLQVGAETGFPGLLCLGLFYGLCVLQLGPLTLNRTTVADPGCTTSHAW